MSKLGRNTQGVTLIKVQEGERFVGVAPILDADDELDPDLLVGSDDAVVSSDEAAADNDSQGDE